jgi:stearoyl-CoA desaturase (delta-9 desaturase)
VRHAVIGLLMGFVLCQVATATTTVYLHRALAHRAVALAPPVAFACRVLTWVSTGIRPRQWVAVHRKHHAFTDVDGDPHSPLLEGFATVQFANVALYRRVARDPAAVARYARDLPSDRWDRVVFDHALLGLGVGVGLLVLVLGPWTAVVAATFHTASYLLLNAAVNAVGHRFGRQPHPNSSRNSQWLAWLTVGEGLHNNHHAAPTSARLSFRRGEIDPGWWVVRLLERSSLASVRHRVPRFKRPEAA